MYNTLSSISSTKKDFALIGRLSLSLLCHFEALYNAEVLGLWTVTGFNVYCFLKASTSKGSKSPAKVGEGGSSGIDFKMVSSGLTENQLQLSVEVSLSSSYLLSWRKGLDISVLGLGLITSPVFYLGVDIPLLFWRRLGRCSQCVTAALSGGFWDPRHSS